MKYEKSCGIIVFDKDKVLLVKHNAGHTSFPKGHVEECETEEETALREVKEETNCTAKINEGFKETITYSPKPGVIKDVVFFVGDALTKDLKNQETEVQETKFVNLKEALDLITYDSDKELLKKALKFKNLI